MKQTQTITIKVDVPYHGDSDVPVEELEKLDQLLDQFEAEIQKIGGRCNISRRSGMMVTSTGFNADDFGQISEKLAAQGVPPEQIKKMQLMAEASVGRRSWESVLEVRSAELTQSQGYDRFNLLMELIDLALNAGQHNKAREYFVEMEGMMESESVQQSLPNFRPDLMRHEIEKKRNWLYPK